MNLLKLNKYYLHWKMKNIKRSLLSTFNLYKKKKRFQRKQCSSINSILLKNTVFFTASDNIKILHCLLNPVNFCPTFFKNNLNFIKATCQYFGKNKNKNEHIKKNQPKKYILTMIEHWYFSVIFMIISSKHDTLLCFWNKQCIKQIIQKKSCIIEY